MKPARGPAGGASTGAAWSSSVPKIESVPSQFSMSSISRCCGGQSAIAGVLISQKPDAALRLEGCDAVVVRVPGDEGDHVRMREEELLQVVAEVERLGRARVAVAARVRVVPVLVGLPALAAPPRRRRR